MSNLLDKLQKNKNYILEKKNINNNFFYNKLDINSFSQKNLHIEGYFECEKYFTEFRKNKIKISEIININNLNDYSRISIGPKNLMEKITRILRNY